MAKTETVESKRQFINRLYGEPAMYGLARLVGYSGITSHELSLQLRGVELPRSAMVTLEQALAEITLKDEDGKVRLTEQARRCCRVLLGPPPESGEREGWLRSRGELPAEEVKPKVKEVKAKPKAKPRVKPVKKG